MKKYLIVLILPFVVYACAPLNNNVRAEKTESDEFSSSQIQKVEAETRNGSIESRVWEEESIRAVFKKWATGATQQDAEGNLKDIDVRVNKDTDSGVLSIYVNTPNRPGTNYGCSISLSLPASLLLDLKSSNGAITVLESQNSVECSTSNGAITIEDTNGNAKLKTSNGKITARNHYGELDAKTSNGTIDADVVLPEGGDCFLKTSNGKIYLSVPEETSAMIEASTSNGGIEIDNIAVTVISMEKKKDLKGKMGDGDGEIRLETSNGSIRITGR